MRLPRALGLAAAIATGLLATLAPSAGATFHLMSIREVYPGSAANPTSEYVELQMWAAGQNLVAGHVLRAYDATGAVVATSSFTADVARSASQSTMVLATPAAEAEFGFRGDAALSPPGQLDPSGGAVCWESIDCVSWGGFSGTLPSPAGSPAAPSGIPDGMALRRSIASGCPTLLEPTDDHDDSLTDFAVAFPAPRPNSVAPTELACSPTSAPPPPSPGQPPQTSLLRTPPKRARNHRPVFHFAASEPGSRFECKLDGSAFHACRSPFRSPRLAPGRHRFAVRAVDQAGAVDPTPASFSFRVLRRRG